MAKHDKTGRNKVERYIMLRHWLIDSPAWKDLDGNARSIYIELCRYYNGQNNGAISYSVRQAAEELNISKSTAGRALRSLQTHGFIVIEQKGKFRLKIRHATEYRLTEHAGNIVFDDEGTQIARLSPPTKEFASWRKIQNTGPVVTPSVPLMTPYGTCSDTEVA